MCETGWLGGDEQCRKDLGRKLKRSHRSGHRLVFLFQSKPGTSLGGSYGHYQYTNRSSRKSLSFGAQ